MKIIRQWIILILLVDQWKWEMKTEDRMKVIVILILIINEILLIH